MAGEVILIVEDNLDLSLALAEALFIQGYAVLRAQTGAEALERVRQRPPSLVIMDLGLPDEDGLDVALRIKEDPALAKVPIIALTGLEVRGELARQVSQTCAAYLPKPVKVEQLLSTVRMLLPERG